MLFTLFFVIYIVCTKETGIRTFESIRYARTDIRHNISIWVRCRVNLLQNPCVLSTLFRPISFGMCFKRISCAKNKNKKIFAERNATWQMT